MAAVAMDDSSIVASVGLGATADRVERWTHGKHWTQVAKSAWPNGFVNWVGVSGPWVLYVDQSRLQDDSHMNVLWKIKAVNVVTGDRRTVASNGAKPDPWVPYLGSTEQGITWTQASKSRRADLYAWEDSPGRAVEVASDLEMTPGSDRAAGTYVYYLGPNGRGDKGHTVGGDCWRVPRVGGPPQAITKTALALSCAPAAGSVFAGLHIDPKTPKPPANGVLDDPYEVQNFSFSGSPGATIETGYISDWYPVAVGRDVIWQGVDGVPVLSDPRGHRISLGSDSASFIRVAGNTILSAANPVRGRVSIQRYELSDVN
ncbi:hypothetical protein P5P86_01015 [Nocardioides sp. BP30]|uniref:hypothetical protein n=1 Tax=Nocardioides sp. BP30 TaxID=3036374 RepID=UPI00246948E4|nr:hypothetical protein [Nocardioides sp. BP30]WGL52422.1 hypothetical protein P5P86_01015 [Nocardioides sp. BP30]